MNTIHQMRRVGLHGFGAAILIATTCTVVLTAQEGTERNGSTPQKPAAVEGKAMNYTSTSRIIGAPVFLDASTEKTVEARQDGKEPERPKAKVTELLIDSQTGELSHAVVSLGGFLGLGDKTVLVPTNDLKWNNSMERFDLGWTTDQLKQQATFDLASACKTGLDAACGKPMHVAGDKHDTGGTDKGTAEASAHGNFVKGTTFVRPTTCLAKASELAALPVYAGTAEWGSVRDLIIDRQKNRVVLAVVNHGSTLGVGGDNYLVAYDKLEVCQKEGDRLLCAKELTPAQLETGVKFEKPKNGVVDPAAAQLALSGSSREVKN